MAQTYSIYHFFADLVRKAVHFKDYTKLEEFPFDLGLLSSNSAGAFPDLSIKRNPQDSELTGGEFVELKDSKGYGVSSFNSTIPTGKKLLSKVLRGKRSKIFKQMKKAGDFIDPLEYRDVFYLVRGRDSGNVKVCLAHGSFFETIQAEDLIQGAFSQVLAERLGGASWVLQDEIREALQALFRDQESFSKVRNIQEASVTLHFRIMTGVKPEANPLNGENYPEVQDNTLNLLLPCYKDEDAERYTTYMQSALSEVEFARLTIFQIRHLLNGPFLVFQSAIP